MPINWSRRKYSQEEFINAWNSSYSIAQVARELKLNIYGSTYLTLKETAKELGLTRTHMTGQGHLKNKNNPWAPKRSLQDVLVYGKKENNGNLKGRLIRELGWQHECSSCGLNEWMSKPIAIELEHINGNSKDNRIENLTFLCPNCHALTDTWRGRNMGRVVE